MIYERKKVRLTRKGVNEMNGKMNQYLEELQMVLAEDLFTHSYRVANMSKYMASYLQLPSHDIERIEIAALFHDVGKEIIRSPIWEKTGNLTEEEFKLAQKHPIQSYEYLMKSKDPYLSSLSIPVRHHHERFDGRGYPDKLSGQNIPISSRIIALCDAYDAMTSIRPYRQFRYSPEKALGILRNGSGRQHDPNLIEVLEDNFDEITNLSSKHAMSNILISAI